MAAATITARVRTQDPTREVVILTASDTNTFVSEKFGNIEGVQATLMEDTATLSIPLSCVVSANTVTLNCTGLSSQKVCLTLYGHLGA